MAQNYSYPPGFTSVSIPSTGLTGNPVPAYGDLIAGRDPTGLLKAVAVDASGHVILSATSIEIGTVDQGTAGSAAQGWYVRLTDGTDVLGTSAHPLRVDPTGTTPQPVTGPLTDAQLRATAVPVSGPLTDAQLRATPVPVSGTVSVSGVATEATLAAFSAKTAGSLVPVAFDYQAITYVGVTTDIDTVVYKSGGAGGTTVATLTMGYDGSNRLSTITRS